MTAFCGESSARNRYTNFTKQAKKEGLVQIADIVEETANQEKEHAKRLFKLLEDGEVEITGADIDRTARDVPGVRAALRTSRFWEGTGKFGTIIHKPFTQTDKEKKNGGTIRDLQM